MMRRPGAGFDVLVIGAGVSGLTAAWHAASNGLRVGVLEPELAGGLLTNVTPIDGFPAMQPLGGAELCANLEGAIRDLGGQILNESLESFQPGGRTKLVGTNVGNHKAANVVLALGAHLRTLDVPGHDALWGRGVSQCAFCDGALYRGQRAVVVGGGNGALQEALHLAEYADEVVLIHRGRRLTALPRYATKAVESEKFRFMWSSEVTEIHGDEGVTGVTVKHVASGEEQRIDCHGVFPFVGLVPNSELLADAVALDADGYVSVDHTLATNIAGVYAIGALRAGFTGS
ncbi:MAG: FAD-dependent oxidoreductase, partial [Chromatiales bacterium]|nr:FAD-dependent oxidoreductase [Chromatiales bacterium]